MKYSSDYLNLLGKSQLLFVMIEVMIDDGTDNILYKFSDRIFSVYKVIKYSIEAPLFSMRVIIITDSVDS